MTGCVFCEIVAGRAPASFVHADDRVVGFMDIGPVTDGHLLVVTRAHAAGLADLDPADGAALFTAAQRLAGDLRRSELAPAGINLLLADGRAAMQEVFHVHLHVIPRYPDDSFRIKAEWHRPVERETLDGHAALIRAVQAAPPDSGPAGG